MELPQTLRAAIEQELTQLPQGLLAKQSESLSQRYRGEARRGQSLLSGAAQSAAYAATRMPATYGAIAAALSAAAAALPDWQPKTVLDVGAGPGTAAWAAAAQWGEGLLVTHVEREPAMMALGQRLEQNAATPFAARWLQADVTNWTPETTDLVLCCYMLGELSDTDRPKVAEKLWQATDGILVLVEPGTPAGFAVLRAVREQLLAPGAHMAAPCPGDIHCPMAGDNWCHFAQRIARSRLHRQAKGGELGYEDEKYSYIALTKEMPQQAAARVLRHPLVRKGHLGLVLCTKDGEQDVTVTRSEGERYRRAKGLQWGSAANLPERG